jgi:hypothetical protein
MPTLSFFIFPHPKNMYWETDYAKTGTRAASAEMKYSEFSWSPWQVNITCCTRFSAIFSHYRASSFLEKRKDQTSLLVQGIIMRSRFGMLGLLLVLAGGITTGSSISQAQNVKCYLPGDSIDPDIFILDVEQNPVRICDIIKSKSKLVVVVIIGGTAWLSRSNDQYIFRPMASSLDLAGDVLHFYSF